MNMTGLVHGLVMMGGEYSLAAALTVTLLCVAAAVLVASQSGPQLPLLYFKRPAAKGKPAVTEALHKVRPWPRPPPPPPLAICRLNVGCVVGCALLLPTVQRRR